MNRYEIPAVICVDAPSIEHALNRFEEIATEGGEGYESDAKSGMVVWLDDDTIDKLASGEITGQSLLIG